MEVKAFARFIRIAPRKVRLVAGIIRGTHVNEALVRLATTTKKSSKVVEKLLKSAMANATHNNKIDPATLYVSEIRVDEGPVVKRNSSRAMGRAQLIRKRMSHISLILSDTPKISGKKISKKIVLKNESEQSDKLKTKK